MLIFEYCIFWLISCRITQLIYSGIHFWRSIHTTHFIWGISTCARRDVLCRQAVEHASRHSSYFNCRWMGEETRRCMARRQWRARFPSNVMQKYQRIYHFFYLLSQFLTHILRIRMCFLCITRNQMRCSFWDSSFVRTIYHTGLGYFSTYLGFDQIIIYLY